MTTGNIGPLPLSSASTGSSLKSGVSCHQNAIWLDPGTNLLVINSTVDGFYYIEVDRNPGQWSLTGTQVQLYSTTTTSLMTLTPSAVAGNNLYVPLGGGTPVPQVTVTVTVTGVENAAFASLLHHSTPRPFNVTVATISEKQISYFLSLAVLFTALCMLLLLVTMVS